MNIHKLFLAVGLVPDSCETSGNECSNVFYLL